MLQDIIIQAKNLNIWRSLDVQFAYMLSSSSKNPALILAITCLSADTGRGHSCLPLKLLNPEQLFYGRYPILARQAWNSIGRPSMKDWNKLLFASSAVSDGSHPTPLVLDKERLYLHRMWENECYVAQFFSYIHPFVCIEKSSINDVLNRCFHENEYHDKIVKKKKDAVAVALTNSVSLISVGPETGKTSLVSQLLAAFLLLGDDARIIMVAPTGKSAIRLSESICLAMQDLNLDERHKKRLPKDVLTLKKFFEISNNNKIFYNSLTQTIPLDILIIDEATMIDLSMMAKVISVLPSSSRVVFIGDSFQLSSVEEISIFSNICNFAKKRKICTTSSSSIADSLFFIHKNYSLNDKKYCISRLANAINSGNVNSVLKFLTMNDKFDENPILYVSMEKEDNYRNMIDNCVKGYFKYFQLVLKGEKPERILEEFNEYRIICVLREGPFGVNGLNFFIEQELRRYGLIHYFKKYRKIYIGHPVIIMQNYPLLGISNGTTGIVLLEEDLLRFYFRLPDSNKIRSIPLSRVSKYETSFAMTVHKSQGSYFNNVALILPTNTDEYKHQLFTRELLYTAITLSSHRISIYAKKEVIIKMITTPIQRRSCLVDRLLISPTSNTRQ